MGVHNIEKKEDFKSAVLADTAEVKIVDYFATWCGPCKAIAPKVVEMSNQDEFSNVKFYKVDVDVLPEVAESEGITAMPTFVAYKNGKRVEQMMGANHGGLIELVKKAMDS